MVEIRVLRTGKALHSLFSSGSVFMVVFFSFLGYFFFFLWLHSSKTEYSLPQVYWTKLIATKENDSHFCFHNTSQPYSFLLGSPWVCRKVRRWLRALSIERWGGFGPGSHPRDLFSHKGHQASILTPVSSSWWKKYNWTKGFPLPPGRHSV